MLQGYLEELRKTSLLEPEEELELWRRDAAGRWRLDLVKTRLPVLPIAGR